MDWPEWSVIPSEGQGTRWFCGMPRPPNPGLVSFLHAPDPACSGRGVQPQRTVSWGVVLELLLPHPSSHKAGLQPPPLPPRCSSRVSISPGPALLESRRLGVPLLTLHPGMLSPRQLVAREWGRRPFPVTSDAGFFLTGKVIRSIQSHVHGHWCAGAAQGALFTSNLWCQPP